LLIAERKCFLPVVNSRTGEKHDLFCCLFKNMAISGHTSPFPPDGGHYIQTICSLCGVYGLMMFSSPVVGSACL